MMNAIELVDTLPVGIDGHHRYSRVGEYLREPAVVTAKVQGIGEFDVLKVLAEELLFSFEILLAKDRLIVVVTPRGGLFWGGVQAGDGRSQMFDQVVELRLGEPEVGLSGCGSSSVYLALKENMQPGPGIPSAFERQHSGSDAGGNSVGPGSWDLVRTGLRIMMKEKGEKEAFAKLPVRDPGFGLFVKLQR